MSWAIERDADGPARLLWRHSVPPVPPVVAVACPRCASSRWVDGKCLACWYHATDAAWTGE